MKGTLTRALIVFGVLAAAIWLLSYLYSGFIGFGERGNTVVPDVKNKPVLEAKKTLSEHSLTFAVSRSEYSDTIPKDSIISQEPDAGMTVKKGRPILLVVSGGRQQVEVPDLVGLSIGEAQVQLENNRLKMGNVQYITHPVAAKDIVTDQDPVPGATLDINAQVNLTVSAGPPPEISMPSITGHDLTIAKSILQESKLRIGQVAWRIEPGETPGNVLTQNPAAGAKIHEGDMVSLVVGAGEATETLPFKQSYIHILLPPFSGEEEVTVWVTDQTATNLVYRGIHQGREKIELMVSGYGDSTVEVYLGSKVLSSGKL